MHSVLSLRQQPVEPLPVPALWSLAVGDWIRRRVGACCVFCQLARTHLLRVPLRFSIYAGLRTFVICWSNAWAAGRSGCLRVRPPQPEPARGRAHAPRHPHLTAVLSGGRLIRISCCHRLCTDIVESGPHCSDECPRVWWWRNFACARLCSVVVDCGSVGIFSRRHDVCGGSTRACYILVGWGQDDLGGRCRAGGCERCDRGAVVPGVPSHRSLLA